MTTELPSRPTEVARRPKLPATLPRYPWAAIAGTCVLVLVTVAVIAGASLPPFLGPALGFWLAVIQPGYLIYSTSFFSGSTSAERVGFSLAAILLSLMLAGLGADLVLPVIGVGRPLDPVPVVLLIDLLNGAAYLLKRRYPGQVRDHVGRTALGAMLRPAEARLLGGSALALALAVLGANRLNNNAGDQVSIAALSVAALSLVLLLCYRHQVKEPVIAIALYLVALSLLLMTSLRGWYLTGHDIQTEYQVFQLTRAHGRWEIALFHNAYNACLSITILPTEFADLGHVDGPYVYKVFYQIMFAVAPVLVYTIARRYWPIATAMLAAIFFISFPTFFTDLPFINRQEIALVFVCVAVLASTQDRWGVRRRRLTFLAACVGVEISHYSSMYIFLGILVVAAALQAVMRLPRRPRRAAHAEPAPWALAPRVVGFGVVLAVAVLTFGWGFLATSSPGAVLTDATASVSGLLGHTAGARSDNVSYSVLFWRTPTSQQVLDGYNRSVLKLRAATAGDTSYVERQSAASADDVKAVAEPLLPLTTAGRLLADAGVPVAGLNTFIRLIAAEAEQLFVLAGVIAFMLVRRVRRQVGWEFFCLSVGCVAVLASVTALPDLSVDYGVLRVFQESLIMIAPILVTGAMAVFRPLGDRWGPRTAAAVGVGIFVSTTGLLPQTLGGYAAQLNLNNSGSYYDSYYVHPQEVAGTQWLSRQVGVLPSGVQATHASNRFLFTSLSKVTGEQFIEDAYPALLRQHAWIILDYSILHTGLASVSYDGDIITYKYPVKILRDSKNLVYNNGGMEVYR